MVSGGTVSGDLSTFKSHISKFGSEVDELSSNWKGQSYDNLNAKADAFISEFEGAISEEMTAFATACDLYVEYKQTKDALSSLQSQTNSDQSQISSYQSKLSNLKSQIESNLATAKSKQLVANNATSSLTSSDAQTSETTNTTNTSNATNTTNQDPNLIYSSKASGYVFPFAKGVRAPVTSHVGKRKAPTKGASSNHQGTDIGAPNGSEIRAIYSGKVITSREFGGYGNCVRIQQDDGNLTYYGHCSKLLVKEGQRVNAGDVVARVGSTGVSTGPHLHLEIRAADYDKNKHLLDSEEIFEGVWPS